MNRTFEFEVDLTLRRIRISADSFSEANEMMQEMTPWELVNAAGATVKHRLYCIRVEGEE